MTCSVERKSVKCVIVGDCAVGKTCLLMRYSTGYFSGDHYIPTIFDNYSAIVKVKDNQIVLLHLWDTAGQESYDNLRQLSYTITDVFIVCYSIDSMASLYHAKEKWIPELRHHSSNTPIILLATKSDLRDDLMMICSWEGQQVAEKFNNVCYMECSSKRGEGVNAVFNKAANLALMPKIQTPKNRRCIIL